MRHDVSQQSAALHLKVTHWCNCHHYFSPRNVLVNTIKFTFTVKPDVLLMGTLKTSAGTLAFD